MDKEDEIKVVVAELQKYELVPVCLNYTYSQLLHDLSKEINFLITHNFPLLISLMYRLDISEKKVKVLLSQAGNTPAGEIIAALIIERQLQKIEARQSFKSNDVCDEEKW